MLLLLDGQIQEICQKDPATEVFEAKQSSQKTRISRHLLICNKSKLHPGVFICHDQKKSRRQLAINDTLEAAMTGASVTKG